MSRKCRGKCVREGSHSAMVQQGVTERGVRSHCLEIDSVFVQLRIKVTTVYEQQSSCYKLKYCWLDVLNAVV